MSVKSRLNELEKVFGADQPKKQIIVIQDNCMDGDGVPSLGPREWAIWKDLPPADVLTYRQALGADQYKLTPAEFAQLQLDYDVLLIVLDDMEFSGVGFSALKDDQAEYQDGDV